MDKMACPGGRAVSKREIEMGYLTVGKNLSDRWSCADPKNY